MSNRGVLGRSQAAAAGGERRRYRHESGDRYRIDRYDETPGFCSFLPGVAGRDGVPLWCFYVNRAQAIVAFGVCDKDHAIVEFLPATWAYQLVGIQGFRTFCKIGGRYYEPFQRYPGGGAEDRCRAMWIEPDRIAILEQNRSLGLDFRVDYFTVANRPLPGLVRKLTVTNTSDEARDLGLLDGLPVIIPATFNDFVLKKMRHITEAFASVELLANGVPFYTPKTQGGDQAEVLEVEEGNFYAAWVLRGGALEPVEPVVDPDVVFGDANDLVTPHLFVARGEIDPSAQLLENRLPCALAPASAALEAGESLVLLALAGWAPRSSMVPPFLSALTHPGDFEALARDSAKVIESVTRPAFMLSAERTLDAYARQNLLDNVLRGGVPVLLPSKTGPAPVHMYARRHGDLERDYNEFLLPPHPLSDGPGNYRDVCQNRRHDVWFHPGIADTEIRMFLELLQADGFNPLSVTGYRWRLANDDEASALCPTDDPGARQAFGAILRRPFSPGELLGWADRHGVHIPDRQAWLNELLSQCDRTLVARGHGGGYWIDHWTYITDLLEAFAGVWPERVKDCLTGRADIGWFDEGAYVRPRREKYVLRASGPLQLGAVVDMKPSGPPLPPVTALGKLTALLATKAVSLDFGGKGIEMEAGRPGWNDSLNGLPGVFGSSTCEAAEAARLASWLLRELPDPPDTEFPAEVADFLGEVLADLDRPGYDWDRAATIRERFRSTVRGEASGDRKSLPGERLAELLAGVERRMRQAVEAATDRETGLVHTYFRARPVEWRRQLDEAGRERIDPLTGSPLIEVSRFEQQPLPLFLEGQVHLLRLLHDDPEAARQVYRSVRAGPLFDRELSMYKLNECLASEPMSIGRGRSFSRGWFENESVWLHMSYKYLLELLRCGLHEEFFADAQTMLAPFMDPEVYGRSVLENCSFIAPSTCPDPGARGRGFIARLSGSTAEFIHIWILLTTGERPFRVVDGGLRLELLPVLPGDWFTTGPQRANWRGQEVRLPANSLACAFLGSVLLTYHNPSRRDTFGKTAVHPIRYALDGGPPVEAAYLGDREALRVRNRQCQRLDVWLA